MRTPEDFARIGMLAAIRDMQDYVEQDDHDRDGLRAFLMGQLIVAGGYDDPQDRDIIHGEG